MTESVEITGFPNNRRVGTHGIEAFIETDEEDISGIDADVKVTASLIINDSEEATDVKVGEAESGTNFDVTLNHNFDSPGQYTAIVKAKIDYFIAGVPDGTDETVTDSVSLAIRPPQDPVQDIPGGAQSAEAQQTGAGYRASFSGRGQTVLENIQTDDDIELNFTQINFEPYDNPSISVDSASRFATHDIIGGTTVRQKIGEEPREFTINGVCEEPERRKVNSLHKANVLDLNSAVTADDGLIRCQIGSASTDPLEDGGAADMDGGEFLYTYNINLIEVEVL